MLFIAIAAVLASAPARLQDTSVHVTFQARAGRASEVLKNLGQAVKMDFQTSPMMENEILVISVKDVPLSDLMARIATATSGEWKQEGSSYRLIASNVIRKQEEKADFDARLAKINKALASRADAEKKHADLAAAQAKKATTTAKSANTGANTGAAKTDVKTAAGDEEDPSDGNPVDAGMNWDEGEMFTKLFHDIDPAAIAQMNSGDRLVYSTDATRTQHSLSGDAPSAINEFIQKHNAAVVDQPIDLGDDETQGMSAEQVAAMKSMMRRQNGKIGQIAKALLVFSQPDMGFGGGTTPQVELRLYDAKGEIAYTAQSSLDDMVGYVDMMAMQEKAEQNGGADADGLPGRQNGLSSTNGKAPAKQTPIEFSEDSQTLEKSTEGISGASPNFRMAISDQLRQKLFLPNIYDPLSFGATDELLAYAKSKDKPLVADVPDDWSTMSMFGGGRGNRDTVESVTRRIDKGKIFKAVADPAFTVLKPFDPIAARAARANRVALATLLQAAEQKTVPSLDDFAAFALNSPSPSMGGLAQSYIMMFVPSSLLDFMQLGASWSTLRFYGLLSSEQRSALASSGKLSFGSLTAAERSEVEQMTYNAPVRLKVDDGKPPKENPLSLITDMSDAMGQFSETDYRTEPTEVAPAGLPAGGYVEVQTSTEPFGTPISVPGSVNVGAIGILGPTELAFFQLMKSSPGGDAAGTIPPLGKLRIGQQMHLNFTFRLAPQVVIREKLTDHQVPKDAPIFDENALPADFQKKIAESLTALKSGGMAGMFGAAMGQGEQIHP